MRRRKPFTVDDTSHPLYPAYRAYRRGNRGRPAMSFEDWLNDRFWRNDGEEALKHPQYHEFFEWMRETQAGLRKCPAGSFPANFRHWLKGGRW